MEMGKDPAFLFYSSDFLTGVVDLTMEERGQYITLLSLQHQKGHLSAKTIRLALGFDLVSSNSDVLTKLSIDDDGCYYNERLDLEINKRKAVAETHRNAGKSGGRPKASTKPADMSDWDEMLNYFNNSCIKCGHTFTKPERPTKDHVVPRSCGGTDDISNLQPLCRQCNSSKCADTNEDYRKSFIADIPQRLKDKWFVETKRLVKIKANKNLTENVNEDVNEEVSTVVICSKSKDVVFEEFYKLYPKHIGKENARKSWSKIEMSDELFETIKAKVVAFSKTESWTKDGGKFVPYPATWLNQRRWEDELETEPEVEHYPTVTVYAEKTAEEQARIEEMHELIMEAARNSFR